MTIDVRVKNGDHSFPPDATLDDIDPETERIISERFMTFDEDVKTASPWADVETRILQKLKTQQMN